MYRRTGIMIIAKSARAAKMASFDHPDDEDIELSETCETEFEPIFVRIMTQPWHHAFESDLD